MATHGTIAAFFSSQETWTVYVECLEQYFAANKIEDPDHVPTQSNTPQTSYLSAHSQFGVT